MALRIGLTGRPRLDAENHSHRSVIDLDAFDESTDEIPLGRPVRDLQPIPDHVRKEAQLPDHQLQRADLFGCVLQGNRFCFQLDDTPAQLRDPGLEFPALCISRHQRQLVKFC